MPDMLVRYKHGRTTFEVPTKEGSVTKYRDGDLKSLDDVVVTDIIFTHYTKGERASGDQLKSAFNTDDMQKCLEQIVRKGDVQLSSGERREILAKKRAEIVEYIHKNYVDPSKSPALPIPVTRIENAMNEMKARINADTPADKQATDMISKMVEVMPMRKATMMTGEIKLSHKHVGSASNIIQTHSKVLKEDYNAQGAVYHVEVSPSGYDVLMSALTRATKGEFEFNVKGAGPSSDATQGQKGGKAKGGGKGKSKKKGKAKA